MTIDTLLETLNGRLIAFQNRPLKPEEILLLRGIWQAQTYGEIAQQEGYDPDYLVEEVAPELYRLLSELTGERVTKKKCQTILESYLTRVEAAETAPQEEFPAGLTPAYPSGAIPLNSPFYIERPAIEQQIEQEIRKPGALVRIKAPEEMGKTSLLLRVLDYGKRLGYRTVSLNLEQIDRSILSDLNRFLRWLCVYVTRQLQLEPKLDDYWDEDIGSKVSCTLYFRSHLLEQIDSPLILALDEVNHLFEYFQVAQDVLPLLRSWYEEAKRLPVWQKLRLLVVHSTEIYVPLQLTQSPFNVGLPIEFTSFTLEEVQQLAGRYGLDWSDGEAARQLMAMVGGHPALVHLAIYHLSRGQVTLPALLKTAPTASGIYHSHLQRHLATLQEQPELASILEKVMAAAAPIPLEPIPSYKLSSMGLIKLAGNQASPSCELYRQYFGSKQPPPPKRRRGVVLTAGGLEKLNEAKEEAEYQEKRGNRFTLEELSERTALSVDTITKILAGEVGVDKQTLKICFKAFELTLEAADYDFPEN